MPIAYRSLMSTDASNEAETKIQAAVKHWLSQKDLALPAINRTVQVGSRYLSHYAANAELWDAERWQIREYWPEPEWYEGVRDANRIGITTITRITREGKVWFWVEVESPWLEYQPSWSEFVVREPQVAYTPAIVRRLVGDLEMNDGEVPVMDAPLQINDAKYLNGLLDSLRDDSRLGAIYLSIPPEGYSLNSWANYLAELTFGSLGMATAVVVDSTLGSDLRSMLGWEHSIPPGSVRTMLPGVRPFDREDAYRHKLLSASKLSASKDKKDISKLSRSLRRHQVGHVSSFSLPPMFLEVDSALLRVARFSDLPSAKAPTAIGPSEQNQKLKNEDLEFYKSIAEAYANEVDGLKMIVNDLHMWQAIAQDNDLAIFGLEQDLANAASQIGQLQKRLASSGRADVAYAPIEIDTVARIPEEFEDLLDRMGEFEFLIFAGDRKKALALDEHSGISSAVAKAWNTCHTLNAYAEMKVAGTFVGSFMNYVRDGGHGGYLRIPEVKAAESESVQNNRSLRAQREIPVDIAVDGSGFVFAESHVALQNGVNNYPRLHFYDATGTIGKVYVGHIGEHLDNTRTN